MRIKIKLNKANPMCALLMAYNSSSKCKHEKFGGVCLTDHCCLDALTDPSFDKCRCFDHSSKVFRWLAFILMKGRFSRTIFSAFFQSSAMPRATRSAHITQTLLPWPVAYFVINHNIRLGRVSAHILWLLIINVERRRDFLITIESN